MLFGVRPRYRMTYTLIRSDLLIRWYCMTSANKTLSQTLIHWYRPSAGAARCPASYGQKGRLSYTVHIYIVYNINSTVLAQQGMARLHVLVLPLGHYITCKHSKACSFTMLGLVSIVSGIVTTKHGSVLFGSYRIM